MNSHSSRAGMAWRERSYGLPAWPDRLPRVHRVVVDRDPGPRRQILSWALSLLSIVVLVLLLNLVVVSQVQHFTSQQRLYDELRVHLAEGSVPIGQTDASGRIVEPGTPLALLEIPALGVREVVVEGTTSRETKLGVGHRRDTPLPGQAGVSVLMGRKASYGGVFKHLDTLRTGDELTVTTGQGVARYRVLGTRTGTTRLPVLDADDGRLTLVTAAGAPYRPTGALRVDAELVSKPVPRPAPVIAAAAIAPSEQVLSGDPSQAFALSWTLQLLVLVVVAAVWSWKRWQRPATWIVFVPVVAALALTCSGFVASFLPNLI